MIVPAISSCQEIRVNHWLSDFRDSTSFLHHEGGGGDTTMICRSFDVGNVKFQFVKKGSSDLFMTSQIHTILAEISSKIFFKKY